MVSTLRSHVRAFPLLMWLVAAGVTLVAVLVWVSFARTLSDASPVKVSALPQTNAVVWRHRVFQSSRALARDLEQSGGSYSTWAKNHPAAADFLAGLDRTRTDAARREPSR